MGEPRKKFFTMKGCLGAYGTALENSDVGLAENIYKRNSKWQYHMQCVRNDILRARRIEIRNTILGGWWASAYDMLAEYVKFDSRESNTMLANDIMSGLTEVADGLGFNEPRWLYRNITGLCETDAYCDYLNSGHFNMIDWRYYLNIARQLAQAHYDQNKYTGNELIESLNRDIQSRGGAHYFPMWEVILKCYDREEPEPRQLTPEVRQYMLEKVVKEKIRILRLARSMLCELFDREDMSRMGDVRELRSAMNFVQEIAKALLKFIDQNDTLPIQIKQEAMKAFFEVIDNQKLNENAEYRYIWRNYGIYYKLRIMETFEFDEVECRRVATELCEKIIAKINCRIRHMDEYETLLACQERYQVLTTLGWTQNEIKQFAGSFYLRILLECNDDRFKLVLTDLRTKYQVNLRTIDRALAAAAAGGDALKYWWDLFASDHGLKNGDSKV